MDLLDYFESLEEMEFNQLAPNAFFSIWKQDLKDSKLNAILRLPPHIQTNILNQFKFL